MRNGFAVGAKTLHRLGKHEVSSRVPSEAMRFVQLCLAALSSAAWTTSIFVLTVLEAGSR